MSLQVFACFAASMAWAGSKPQGKALAGAVTESKEVSWQQVPSRDKAVEYVKKTLSTMHFSPALVSIVSEYLPEFDYFPNCAKDVPKEVQVICAWKGIYVEPTVEKPLQGLIFEGMVKGSNQEMEKRYLTYVTGPVVPKKSYNPDSSEWQERYMTAEEYYSYLDTKSTVEKISYFLYLWPVLGESVDRAGAKTACERVTKVAHARGPTYGEARYLAWIFGAEHKAFEKVRQFPEHHPETLPTDYRDHLGYLEVVNTGKFDPPRFLNFDIKRQGLRGVRISGHGQGIGAYRTRDYVPPSSLRWDTSLKWFLMANNGDFYSDNHREGRFVWPVAQLGSGDQNSAIMGSMAE